jgi:hypothetical protein
VRGMTPRSPTHGGCARTSSSFAQGESATAVDELEPADIVGYSADASSAVKKAKELIEPRRETVPA